ncbi:hypothetical protein [Cystobacter fuscus]|uniref:hypothetical protein n=1 Tax=Cystobacter fuscus TaxID=43 RepID=UPI0037BF1487
MSWVDLNGWWRRTPRGWRGLHPPPLGPAELWSDLRWHRALYVEDGLPLRQQAMFLALRVVQRVSYNLGWRAGGRP